MRTRLTYVPLEVADQFEDFIIKRDVQVLDAVKAKTRDYSTLSLLKLLYQLKGNSMTFSELYSKSKIRMKKSFLNYLHLCVDYRFIEKEAVGPNMIYSITDKGRTMLNLFIQKNNWVNNMGNISPDTSQKEIQVSN
jgi:DNA-binding HxlR family transcriptional regulator